MMKLWSLVLVSLLALSSVDADAARRMGGGGSIGKQSGNVSQRQGTPPAAAPNSAQNANTAAAKPAAAAPAATPPKRPWGAMLGGLAAGLGLAWLASSLGLGAAFGNILMFALLALAVMMVIGYFVRRKAAGQGQSSSPFAFQGAGAGTGASAESARPVPQYSQDKVGNDASARPWERNSMAFDSAKTVGGGTGVQIGSALAGSQNWGVPADFDTEGFISAAKRNFVTLQDAWDKSDISTLRSMMTDEMLGEIRSQLAEREGQAGAQPGKTEVVSLEAQVLGIEDLGDAYMASVEFSGMIREEPSASPTPFREVWNMTKPKAGYSGWLVAGLQAMQ
ncbi:MAG: 39S ribosomal protein L45 [Ramlibacter sp.]|nr:39S ribosomal protein L45 [Ramlibacter sp.]